MLKLLNQYYIQYVKVIKSVLYYIQYVKVIKSVLYSIFSIY